MATIALLMQGNWLSRREFIKSAALALPLAAAGCGGSQTRTAPSRKAADDFVTVRDGRFELGGRPFFYIGTNLWYGCYLGDSDLPGGRERLIREFDRLREIGVTNIRILGGSETSPLAGAISRGITRAPNDYDEGLLRGLDFCIAEAGRRGIRSVLYLSNYWQWSGGFARYVNLSIGAPIPDPDRPEMGRGDWQAFMRFSAQFYADSGANQLYRTYITRLIQRRNSVNGRLYRDDPAIMAWELANEPRPGNNDEAGAANLPAFYNWIAETSGFIHSLDPNHLVCTGNEGTIGCLQKEDIFVKAHNTPGVDYLTLHVWPKNWNWLKDPQLSPEYEKAATLALDMVNNHIKLAGDPLRKPLVLEEFGLPRDHERLERGTPTTARDDFYRRMFGRVVESCQAGAALQGANFWAWGGEGRPDAGRKNLTAVMVGDPFFEPQGLNSIFDTDRTTHAVIAQASEKLARLMS